MVAFKVMGACPSEWFQKGALDTVELRAGLGFWFLHLLTSCVTRSRFLDLSEKVTWGWGAITGESLAKSLFGNSMSYHLPGP
jgi:hypothetical protein